MYLVLLAVSLPKDVGGRAADSPDPHWYGYSVGHWEGDYTFVVDTVGIDERTWLDAPGHAHSLEMRLEERYARVDHNTIEMIMNVDDPKTYTKPFVLTSERFRWLPKQDLAEEFCVPSLMQEYLNIIGDPASSDKPTMHACFDTEAADDRQNDSNDADFRGGDSLPGRKPDCGAGTDGYCRAG